MTKLITKINPLQCLSRNQKSELNNQPAKLASFYFNNLYFFKSSFLYTLSVLAFIIFSKLPSLANMIFSSLTISAPYSLPSSIPFSSASSKNPFILLTFLSCATFIIFSTFLKPDIADISIKISSTCFILLSSPL